jgi:hypothetical protein
MGSEILEAWVEVRVGGNLSPRTERPVVGGALSFKAITKAGTGLPRAYSDSLDCFPNPLASFALI